MVLNIPRFRGKIAIVTDASAGIGTGIAQELVKNGLVRGLSRRIERIDELAKKLSTEKGKLYAYKCDITKEKQLISTIKEIISKLGNVHVLINNAGLVKDNKTEGHIIHINSILGHTVMDMPGISFYTASKFAVTALVEKLRQEINRVKLTIKVISLSPKYVKTHRESLPILGLSVKNIADAVVYTISTP
ncbi:farnesol dehydrogenase-like [Euwallacea similis]|uniref:farnesol dehydrogenase-like n=1 Tax=Euwallacea similis TaxID=1736056 RepID=UPI00344FCDF4